MNLTRHHILFLMIFAAAMGTGGCSQYAFTINDQEIYAPPPLFSDYKITDPNLRECVKQTILDNNITSADQLTQLGCSSAGIETIEGLNQFTKLSLVDLRNNPIEDLSPLLLCDDLEKVLLKPNSVADCATVSALRKKGVEIDNIRCR